MISRSKVLARESAGRQWRSVPDAHLRAMWPADLEQVLLIERACFPRTYAWESDDFCRCFALESRNLGWVVEMAGRLVAYAVLWVLNPHILVLDNLAVLPSFRRMGIASLLLLQIEESRAACRPLRLRALVRERNLPAQLCLRAAGWRAVGLLKRPWEGIDEDGIKFRKWVK